MEREELTAAQVEEKIEKMGNAAREVNANLALKTFFDRQEKEHLTAFDNLPLDATREQYQAVRLSSLAMRRLRMAMAQYIDDLDQQNEAKQQQAVEGV